MSLSFHVVENDCDYLIHKTMELIMSLLSPIETDDVAEYPYLLGKSIAKPIIVKFFKTTGVIW